MALTVIKPSGIDTSGNYTVNGMNVSANASVANLSVTNSANLGEVGNVKITGGTNGYVLQTDGSGNLSWTSQGTGISTIGNGNSNVNIPVANGNVNISAVGNANILIVTGTGANISGTANVTGNLTAGNANLGNTATASFFVGSGNNLSNIQGANVTGQVGNALVAGTVYTNAQPNITSTGTLTSLNVSGNANTGNLGTTNLIATGTGSFSGNVNMNTYWINNVGYPSANTDAASKSYVDTMVSSGISYHQPVYVATTTTLATATGGTTAYNSPNGAANGIGAYISTTGTFLNIDSANVQTVGTRILVKDEANATWNGVYTYANTTAIVRATDADQYGPDSTEQFSINDFFFTTNGIVNEGTAFVVSAPAGTITFGTSNITFSVFSTSQVYDAGTGLTLTGTTFSISNTSVTGASYGNGDRVATFTVNGQGQLTAASNTVITANAANLTGTTLNAGINTSNLTSVGSLTGLTVSNASGVVNFTTTANVTLGAVGNLHITGGTSSYVLQTDGAGNLSWTAQGSGVSGISNGTSNISIPTVNGNVNITANGNTSLVVNELGANISGNLQATGNINGQYFIGNGSFLTGVDTSPANIANGTSNVQVYLDSNVTTSVAGNANILTVTGTGIVVAGNATIGTGTGGNLLGVNVVSSNTVTASGNINAAGNINGQYFIGNGFYLTGVDTSPANISNGISNVQVYLDSNITMSVAGNANILTVTGTGINISGNATIGTGTGGNLLGVNVVASNTVTTTGNITAGANVSGQYFIGNGSFLTGVDTSPANVSNGTSNVQVYLDSNVTMSVAGNANILTVTGTGINISGNATIGTGTGGNLSGANVISANTFIALTSANFVAASNVNLGDVGNVKITGGTGGYVLQTDGAGNLSWIAQSGGGGGASNISNGNSNVNIPTANGNVVITAVGNTTLTVTGTGANISGYANITGNVNAPYFIGNGAFLTGVDTSPANISNGTSNVQVTLNGNINTSVGGVANVFRVTSTGANIAGYANITGNVNAPYFIGNGAFLTGVDTSPANISNGTSNVQVISSGGNITTSVGGVANVFVVTSTGANVNGTFKVSGQSNLGAVSNVVITGGTADYVLRTDGAGNLSWVAQVAGSAQISNGNSNVRIATANGNVTIAAVGNSTMTITGTGANISGTANVTGNIIGANLMGPLANGTSNVRIAAVNGNVTVTAVGNTIMTVTGTGANISGYANITGNVNAPYFIGNGAFLTGVDTSPANISNGTSNVQVIQNGNVNISVNGNANIVTVTGTGSNIAGYLTASGNVTAGNISTGGQLTSTQATGTAPLVVLSTTQVANLNAAIAGTVTTNAQPNITSVGTLTGLTVSNATSTVDVSNTANVSLGNASNLHITGGSANYVLKTDGSGNLDWVAVGGISVISSISNGNSNVDIATSNGNVRITAVGNTTMTVTGTGANISGYANITGNVSLTGANVNLGAVSNLRISGGASSYVLSTDGASNLSWIAQSGGGGSSSAAIQEFSATQGQTTFTVVGGYQLGSVIVFVNGIQMNNGDYTATDNTTVVLSEPRNAGDVVRILSSMASPSVNINSLQNFSVAMSIALGI